MWLLFLIYSKTDNHTNLHQTKNIPTTVEQKCFLPSLEILMVNTIFFFLTNTCWIVNIHQKCLVPVKGTGIFSKPKCCINQIYLSRCNIPDFFFKFCDVDHFSNNLKPLKNPSIIWGKFKDLWENWTGYFEYKFIFYTLPKFKNDPMTSCQEKKNMSSLYTII